MNPQYSFFNLSDLIKNIGFAGNKPGTSKKSSKKTTTGDSDSVTMLDLMQKDHDAANAFTAVYTRAINTRRQFLKDMEEVRNFYLVDAILGLVTEDALTPDAVTGEVVELTSDKPNVRKDLEELQSRVNLDIITNEIVGDLLANGEYVLRIQVDDGLGIKEILDDVDQANVVAFYDSGLPVKFLRMSGRSSTIEPAHKFVHFCLGKNKIRVKIDREMDLNANTQKPDLPISIPKYARVGRPLLYGTLSKIKELQLLESLVPASKLAEITTGTLVGVSIPTATSPKDAFDTIRRYEDLLNPKVGIDKASDQLSLREILTVAGKIKPIPIFGDRGALTNMQDVKRNQSVDDLLGSIQDNRSVICTSIGIPPELLFSSDGEGKAEMLKRYARYLRKLKNLQRSLADGYRQLALIHLVNRGHKDLTLGDVTVQFRNEIISIDELEKLEFVDAVVAMLSELHSFATDMKDGELVSDAVDTAAFTDYLRNTMSLVMKKANFIKATKEKSTTSTAVTLSDPQLSGLSVGGTLGEKPKKAEKSKSEKPKSEEPEGKQHEEVS